MSYNNQPQQVQPYCYNQPAQPYGYNQPAQPNGYGQPQPQVMQPGPYPPSTNPPTELSYVVPVQSYDQHDQIHDWSSGLCSFCEDFGVCFGTLLCCPCKTLNTRKVVFNKDNLTCCEKISCIPMCVTTYIGLCICESCCECKNRSKLKEQLHFKNTSSDCCKTLFCMPCVVCQHQREIKFRKKMGMFQNKK